MKITSTFSASRSTYPDDRIARVLAAAATARTRAFATRPGGATDASSAPSTGTPTASDAPSGAPATVVFLRGR